MLASHLLAHSRACVATYLTRRPFRAWPINGGAGPDDAETCVEMGLRIKRWLTQNSGEYQAYVEPEAGFEYGVLSALRRPVGTSQTLRTMSPENTSWSGHSSLSIAAALKSGRKCHPSFVVPQVSCVAAATRLAVFKHASRQTAAIRSPRLWKTTCAWTQKKLGEH